MNKSLVRRSWNKHHLVAAVGKAMDALVSTPRPFVLPVEYASLDVPEQRQAKILATTLTCADNNAVIAFVGISVVVPSVGIRAVVRICHEAVDLKLPSMEYCVS